MFDVAQETSIVKEHTRRAALLQSIYRPQPIDLWQSSSGPISGLAARVGARNCCRNTERQ